MLAVPTHRDCWWLEIDRGTESIPRLLDKIRDYRDHADSGGTGPHGARPRVLFTAPDPHRTTTIRATAGAVDPNVSELITATTQDEATTLMITELVAPI